MPQYEVILRINVPGLGQRLLTTPPLVATDMADAIQQAIATIIIEPTTIRLVGP